MKKLVLLCFALIFMQMTFGQLTGTKSIPGDYATIEAAIAAINSQGVGSGGVTFNVNSTHSETFSTPTAGTITTNTSSATNPIIFQNAGGGGNPVITAAVLASASATDGMIKFAGCDYVTFNGIILQENAANITNLTDWGFAILKESATNGSQNITIKNCSISLNKANTASYGIYSNNHTATSTTQLTGITTAAGTNSNNKISGNAISNVYGGIYIYGFADATIPYTYYDQNNEIGVSGGNNLSDFGGGTVAIYGIYAIYQNGLAIINNNFTGALIGAAAFYGIYTGTSYNANIIIQNNNLSFSYNGTTQTVYGIYSAGGGTGTSNNLSLNNNIVSINYNTATSGGIYGIYHSASCYNFDCFGNNIVNNILGSATTAGTGTFGGIYTFGGNSNAGSTWNISYNQITGNQRVQSVLGSGTGYYLYNSSAGLTFNMFNNTVSNNTTASSGTTYCLYNLASSTTKAIYGNVISDMLNANSSVYGIYQSAGTNISIYNNKIQNLNSNATGSIIYGVYLSSGTSVAVYNNYISELKTPAATGNPAVYGMYMSGGTNLGAYYNTIYLNASSTGATFGAAGIYASTTPTVELRNNIVVNNSTPGATGRIVAYQRSTSTLTTYAATSNNNDFYVVPGASNFIYYDGTNSDLTLAAFKARVSPRDASSVSENPAFVNVASFPYNLHIQTTIPSQCESGGATVSIPVNIIDDFDGNPRYPNAGYPNNGGSPASAPDIGADEFGGLTLDITPPNITFTALGNTSGTGARLLTTTITDASGVPTANPGLPVLYWKINSGSYTPVTAAWVSGSTYNFTFGAGAVLGDAVSYYIVAQDNVTPTPNVGSNPSGGASGFTANPPACSTPPTTPYSYIIVGQLCGNYNVGAGQVYTTLTAAVADLNLKEITCPVTLTLMDASYSASETFPLAINAMAGSSPVNTVTIKPAAGISPVISGNSATAIFKFNGAQNIIIDGSNSGGTTRDLTITNTATTGTTAVVWIGSLGAGMGASNNLIKNCNIANGYNVGSAYGIFIGSASAIGTTGDVNHNVTIQNNAFSKAYYGIYSAGSTSGLFNNLVIQNNVLGSAVSTDYIGFYAIYLAGANAPLVKGNEIYNMITTTATNQTGIWLNSDLVNPVIEGNRVHDLQNNNSGGWGAWGINVNAATVSGATIVNNVIYNINTINYSATSTTYNPFGIRLVAGTGHKIYHNTVHLTGTQFNSGTTGTLSACLLLTASSVTGLDVRDNIFTNNLEGMAGTKSYAVYAPAGTTFGTINYNNYYAYGTYGILGFLGADQTTLPAWQTATGQDANSVVIIPSYTAEYRPTNTSLDNVGFYLTFVPADYSGVLRTNPPDMGAYEFGINPEIFTLAPTGVNCAGGVLNGSIMAMGLTVNSYFDYGTTVSYGSSIAGTPPTVTGTSLTPISAVLSIPAGTTYHYRARGVTSAGVTSYGEDMTITTTASGAPTATTMAATSIGTNNATLNGTVNAFCNSTTVTFQYGLTMSYGYTATAAQSPLNGGTLTPVSANITGLMINTLYHFRVVAQNSEGTTYGTDLTFTTGAPPIVTTNPATNIGNFAARLNGTVNANTQSTTVTFQWGLTVSYGFTIAGVPGTVTGSTPTAVYADLTGLNSNTVYHFRCVGQSVGGTTYGADQVFTTLCPLPAAPGAVTGPESVCQASSGHVYTVPAITYATGYVWTLPTGGTITAGGNTNSITVSYDNSAVSGNVSVYGTSVCGNGPASNLAVTVNPLPVPTITGPNMACITSSYTYSTEAGMTAYVWTVSAGGQITAGSETNTVTIKWNSAGAQSVSVTYTSDSGCPAAAPTTMNVTVGTLPSPTITGSNMVCVNSGLHVYTTETGFSDYVWTVTSGGTIINGQGTYQIEVNWTVGGAQTVTVNYENAYGCSATSPATYAVTVMPLPGAAGPITGTPEICGGAQHVNYSVAVISNVLDYIWTLPAGATIVLGENTNSIMVDFALDAVSGSIAVHGENLCGSGPSSPAYQVTVNPVPPTPVASVDEFFVLTSSAPAGNQWYFNGGMIDGANGQYYQAEEEGSYYTIVTLNGCSSELSNMVDVIFTGLYELNGSGFSIYPIPNDGKFTVAIVIPGEETFSIHVYNDLGIKVYEMSDLRVNGKAQQTIDLNNPSKGIYTVVFQGSDHSVMRKVLVTK